MKAAKLALALCSVLISILLLEGGLRLFLHPMDYLAPVTVYDPVLGFHIVPGTGGHDDWGFRNDEVPDRVDVVALGDSMTWGVAARAAESWPSWYGRKTGQSVYNLGIGGYGPAEYLYLLETKGLSLRPRQIVVGWYLGNDSHDAYTSVRDRHHWADLRTESMGPLPEVESETTPMLEPPPGSPVKVVRNWLRRNSMFFRVIEAGPLGQLANAWGDQRADWSGIGCALVTEEPFTTVIQAESRFRGVNLGTDVIVDGFELSKTFIGRIAERAKAADIELLVVVLPTKETVVVGPKDHADTACEEVLQQLIADEATLRSGAIAFLEEQGIEYVDLLDAMRSAALEERIYLMSADTHPNGRGYEVVADEMLARPEPK